jgi:hypothetical protein
MYCKTWWLSAGTNAGILPITIIGSHLIMEPERTSAFALQHTLLIPAHVSTLTYTKNARLIMGSGEQLMRIWKIYDRNSEDDGSLRLYHLPDTKVVQAIRGLGSEVSSVSAMMPNSSDIWVACGSSVRIKIFPFVTKSYSMIHYR